MPPSGARIERVTFSNEENGYTVAKVKVYGRSDLVTVIGNMANPTPGEILQMTGEWGNHPKYGEQFKLVFYKTVMPATAYAIEKYLGSGLIKGIGPVMARRMVKVFAEKTLDVIELEPDRLCEVPGIGKARIGMIRRAWEEQKAVREVMIFSRGTASVRPMRRRSTSSMGIRRFPLSRKIPTGWRTTFSASVF